jgi:recombination protein RecA
LNSLSENRGKALQLAVDQIERKFGKGYIMQLDGRGIEDIPVISTGSFSLDHALGVGGIPRGRVTEIFGPESGGKTTLALHIMAEAQKMNGIVAFIDAEHALDIVYAKKLGVMCNELLVFSTGHR